MDDGKIESEVAGAPIGTQVTVRDLFYNAPARRKFLKSPLRETELIQKTIVTYALAYPQIAFRFIVDGRENLNLPVATPLERIGAVWGREVAGEMVAMITPRSICTCTASSRGRHWRAPSREWQMFFVNHRPIRSGLLAVMLERPYAGRLPPNRHPLAVIQIDIDPQLVDVNVHPRKAEVRFYQERAIYNAVTQAVEDALREFPLLPARRRIGRLPMHLARRRGPARSARRVWSRAVARDRADAQHLHSGAEHGWRGHCRSTCGAGADFLRI